jgi:hypothetical protein
LTVGQAAGAVLVGVVPEAAGAPTAFFAPAALLVLSVPGPNAVPA